MALCGTPPLVDDRAQRVDFATTIGQPWATAVVVSDKNTGALLDLTGAIVEAGLMNGSGAEVASFTQGVSLATSTINLSLTGAEVAAPPLGLGTWTWYLRVRLLGDAEFSYWVTGTWAVHAVRSTSASGACGPDVVDVCVGSEILVTVDACVGSQGEAGGQAHVGPLPPADLAPGMIWMMTPESHTAIYSPIGWLPLWPQTDNLAVEAGDALLGIDGLWVAEDGD